MAVKPLEKVLLNPIQVEEIKEDIKTCEAQMQNPRVQEKGMVRDRMQRLKRQLDEEAASEGDQPNEMERDRLSKLERQLREQITQGMLSEEEMRKCPSEAPRNLLRWETANIKKIEVWRNIRQQLDPHNPEAGNLEVYRRRGAQDRVRLVDTVIQGQMDYNAVPQERWDMAFDETKKVNSALDQAKKRVKKAKAEKPKRMLTPEQKAALRSRLALGRAAKLAKEQAKSTTPQGEANHAVSDTPAV